jgi:hypothetical protein
MVTFGGIFSVVRSAIASSQAAMQVASQNVANAETDGYSRQRVELTARQPLLLPFGSLGTGVDIANVTRARDAALDSSFRRESANAESFGGGLDFLAHLSLPGIAWSSGLYFFWNPIEIAEAPASVDLGSWINVPLVTGARVQTPKLGGAARLFAQFQAGANFASQTDSEVPGGAVEVGWSTSLAFTFGVGAILLDRIHVGARYFHLGEPEYRLDDGGVRIGTQEPRVVALMIGAYFNTTN